MKRTIEKTLDAFDFADLQTFRNILVAIRIDGYGIPDVLQYVTDKEQSILRRRHYIRRCPECRNAMLIGEVNTTKCNQIGGEYKSQWFCPSCEYEEFSTEDTNTEIDKYGG